jgi:tetratricopeptide (TPR) repeat protein
VIPCSTYNLLEGNNLELAKDYLNQALKLNPNLGFAHYNMGLVKKQEKNWSSALASFQKARTMSQNAPEPAYHLGVCYLQQGKVEQAKAAFNEAMENVKNQVIAELAENLKEQLTQKLGKYTTLNMNGGVVAVAIDDEGLVEDILEDLFEEEC